MALRNISIIPRVPEQVLDVRELFRNSAVTHSSTGSTYPRANKQTRTHMHAHSNTRSPQGIHRNTPVCICTCRNTCVDAHTGAAGRVKKLRCTHKTNVTHRHTYTQVHLHCGDSESVSGMP